MSPQRRMSLREVALLPFKVFHRGLHPARDATELTGVTRPSNELESVYRATAASMDVSAPDFLVAHSSLPFAFVVGNTVVMSARAADLLHPDEQRAILAHEIAHVKQRDGRSKIVAALLLRVVLPIFLVKVIQPQTRIRKLAIWTVANIVGGLATLAMSRRLEKRADNAAREVTSADTLSCALAKLKQDDAEATPGDVGEEQSPPIFLRSHPPLDHRLEDA